MGAAALALSLILFQPVVDNLKYLLQFFPNSWAEARMLKNRIDKHTTKNEAS
jgi:hypothetical protein